MAMALSMLNADLEDVQSNMHRERPGHSGRLPRVFTQEEERRQELTEAISRARADIVTLESTLEIRKRKLDEQSPDDCQDLDSLLLTHITGKYDGSGEEGADATTDLPDVRALAGLTGIRVTSTSNKLFLNDDNVRMRKYNIEGTVREIKFKVHFVVKDDELAVTELHPTVCVMHTAALAPFLGAVAETRSLRLFFKGLGVYAEHLSYRSSAFRKAREEAKAWCTLPHGPVFSEVMHIVPPEDHTQTRRMHFSVSWKVSLSSEGEVTESIALLPRLSIEFTNADSKGLAERLPSDFRSLMQLSGVETAIVIMIRTVVGASS